MEYEHQTSLRSRGFRLRLKNDGSVVVTTPPLVPRFMIDQFVASHQNWIIKQQAKLTQRLVPVQSDRIMIFGQWYQVVVDRSLAGKTGVKIEADQVIVTPADPKATSVAIQLNRFIKQTAEKYLIPRTHQWADQMGIEFRAISLREQKTRWGSCSSRGNLQFNWRLVHYPPEVIDYVIVHELSHRRQMNHSRAFWDIVRHYDPAYQQHRGWLKRHGWSEG